MVYDTPRRWDRLALNWLGLTRGTDPTPAFVRLEGRDTNTSREFRMNVSPLPLFSSNAEVLDVGAVFADLWYHDLWNNLENIGPQLTTLHLDVIEGIDPGVAGGEGVRQGEIGNTVQKAGEEEANEKFLSLMGFRNQGCFILGFQHASPVPSSVANFHVFRLFIQISKAISMSDTAGRRFEQPHLCFVGFQTHLESDRFILGPGFQHASPVPPNAAYSHIMCLFFI